MTPNFKKLVDDRHSNKPQLLARQVPNTTATSLGKLDCCRKYLSHLQRIIDGKEDAIWALGARNPKLRLGLNIFSPGTLVDLVMRGTA
jgi:hypothetical protein